MTNKEALKWLEETVEWYEKEYPFCNPNNEQVEVYKVAIKALHIVVDIEANFKRHSNFMMDSDDWDDIKTFAEKVCNGEFDDENELEEAEND